ncbi:hypothetical protein FV232_24155 [Methylobacterium sp. WL30]|jgi:hypothetical protein|uniref:hypothetical protein n=1 Tax=unclassified Methylobacterium TaxID=2615210 RepID=UPI0011CA2723|nr:MULTISPECIES: hypothetical protein [unclassified Methylobacterium]MCJ2008440.1 hypothetical protein [Methylobacterium sp. J-092]MCJ2075862.1 hypothetical protein [Methylobacterium sp. E-016]TXM94544.1 hypothetical protein FV223_04320 [Methylobacterium sp. WL116]TXN30782.1 hypothetical protein FV225_20175 [Methylobacterium sp. WL93]TXN50795.1 hypothetical protein FV227_10385 [Methylobacterium sp. WL119]
MSLALAIPAAEAAMFTAGCAAIHALRRQADGVTLGLAGLLAIVVLLLGIAWTPDLYLAAQTDDVLVETTLSQPIP